MNSIKHTIEKRVYQSKWYKWIALLLAVLLLFCFLLKCCSPLQNLVHAGAFQPLPTQPNKVQPVDPDKIEIVPDDPFEREAVNDLINVYLIDSVDIAKYSESVQKMYNGDIIEPTYYAEEYKRVQFRVVKEKRDSLMFNLRQDKSRVKFVTHEWIFRQSFSNFNDPDFNDPNLSWFYSIIGLAEAWKFTRGDTSIKIAVIDDGFDLNHPELRKQFVRPWNVNQYNDDVYGNPQHIFHGTHVAATIVGELNNGFGISGVSPNCSFIPIQICDANGFITITAILDGIFYALKNKANIINLSLGFSLGTKASSLSQKEQQDIIDNYLKDEEQLWEEVFKIALESNVVIVQAAGNDNVMAALDPMKRNTNCITVGASNNFSQPADFSNYGNAVTIFAPGEKIYSALPNQKMGSMDGTSMASPIVAGCVALIKSYRPNLSAQEIISLITKSASSNNQKVIRIDEILSLL